MSAAEHFTPSSSMLLAMIASANSKCDADREQMLLRKEARALTAHVRAWEAQVAARHYARLQHPTA